MSNSLFRGICASTVTPFDHRGQLAMQLLSPHIEWILAEGADAISPLGSSGEFPAMESDDRKRIIEAALAINNGRVPVIAGTHHYSTRIAIELSKHAEKAGADGLLIVQPYYMAPTPTQAMDHYRRIAEAVSIPIVLYHNVRGTCVNLTSEHLIKLFEEKVIAGVKMSNPEPDRVCQLLQATSGELTVYAGLDTAAFEGLCHGAHGWISGIPSLVPRAAKELYTAIATKGDLPLARRLWRKLAPLMRLQFSAFLSGGDGAHWLSIMKAALNMIGPPVGDPAPPVLPLQQEFIPTLATILKDLEYKVRT
jgi:4-hydroxy-tetrahydrodipicolinate synthase